MMKTYTINLKGPKDTALDDFVAQKRREGWTYNTTFSGPLSSAWEVDKDGGRTPYFSAYYVVLTKDD